MVSIKWVFFSVEETAFGDTVLPSQEQEGRCMATLGVRGGQGCFIIVFEEFLKPSFSTLFIHAWSVVHTKAIFSILLETCL